MSQAFYDMMHLFACGARGRAPVLDHTISVNEVYRQAMVQATWHTVFLGLKRLCASGGVQIPKQQLERWQMEVEFTVLQAARRQVAVNNIVEKLEQEGIECCLLKGNVLAELYETPSCRISADTDLLIQPQAEKRAIEIMKQNGFQVEERAKSSNQTVCRSKEAGTIELHISLNNKLMDEIWFRDMAQKTESHREFRTSEGLCCHTLGVTDGLVLVVLHFIKHFINRAAGIRMAMDTLLYMEHYYEQIDWEKFHKLMQELKYEKFMQIIMAIGENHMFFSTRKFGGTDVPEELIQKVLADMEEGGNQGFHSIESLGFYDIYSAQRMEKQGGEYKKYQQRNMLADYKKLVFLEKKEMVKKYPYLEKRGFLLPLAWTHRIVSAFWKKIFGHPEPVSQSAQQAIDKRMELIRELDMI